MSKGLHLEAGDSCLSFPFFVCYLDPSLFAFPYWIHLMSLGFSYLGHGVSLQGCFSKEQLLLLTLDEEYLLTAAPPDPERGLALLGPMAPYSSTLAWKTP